MVNLESFISKKLFKGSKGSFSSAIIKLSIASIALGLTVMIISIGVSRGFQFAIKEKVAGFEGNIRISKFDLNQSQELSPIIANDSLIDQIEDYQEVSNVNKFGLKGGIIKHEGLIEGIILKGVDNKYNWGFFKEYLIKGGLPLITDSNKSNNVIISSTLANKINIDIGNSFLMYFIQDPPRTRKFTVCGIYNTGFEEFDANYIIGDIKQIQKLNNWSYNQVSGLEIHLNTQKNSAIVNRKLSNLLDYDIISETLSQRYPMIVDWLNLLDTNVYFIIGLMILISGITIIATLLILILEKTNSIGILKALGTSDYSIRKIFLYRSAKLIVFGMLIGNTIGISLGFLQKHFEIIPLDPKSYYMNTVPFDFSPILIVALNIGVLLVTFLMIIWPSTIIARISPIKAIRFK